MNDLDATFDDFSTLVSPSSTHPRSVDNDFLASSVDGSGDGTVLTSLVRVDLVGVVDFMF